MGVGVDGLDGIKTGIKTGIWIGTRTEKEKKSL